MNHHQWLNHCPQGARNLWGRFRFSTAFRQIIKHLVCDIISFCRTCPCFFYEHLAYKVILWSSISILICLDNIQATSQTRSSRCLGFTWTGGSTLHHNLLCNWVRLTTLVLPHQEQFKLAHNILYRYTMLLSTSFLYLQVHNIHHMPPLFILTRCCFQLPLGTIRNQYGYIGSGKGSRGPSSYLCCYNLGWCRRCNKGATLSFTLTPVLCFHMNLISWQKN